MSTASARGAKSSIAGESFRVWFKQSKIRSYCARLVDEPIIFHRGKSYFSHFFVVRGAGEKKKGVNPFELTPLYFAALTDIDYAISIGCVA
jgi:hypothetical protein